MPYIYFTYSNQFLKYLTKEIHDQHLCVNLL